MDSIAWARSRPTHSPASAGGMAHRPLLHPAPSGSGAGGEGARVKAAPQRHEDTKVSPVDGIARARQRPPHSAASAGGMAHHRILAREAGNVTPSRNSFPLARIFAAVVTVYCMNGLSSQRAWKGNADASSVAPSHRHLVRRLVRRRAARAAAVAVAQPSASTPCRRTARRDAAAVLASQSAAASALRALRVRNDANSRTLRRSICARRHSLKRSPHPLFPLPAGEGPGVRARGRGLRHRVAPQRHEGTKVSLVDGIAQARQRPPHSAASAGGMAHRPLLLPAPSGSGAGGEGARERAAPQGCTTKARRYKGFAGGWQCAGM